MNTNNLVLKIKENNEDFEWYPTTEEIVDCFVDDLKKQDRFYGYNKIKSILDIGCGNGSFFDKYEASVKKFADENNPMMNIKFFGIEKSQTLINNIKNDVVILGTEFFDQSLIDKEIDVSFCNPPYSEYESWVEKIIFESMSDFIYFVIPDRWEKSERISFALKERQFKTTVLGNFDFNNAERKARAKVCLVKLESNHKTKDAFNFWFDKTFSIDCKEKINPIYQHEKIENIEKELVQTEDFVSQIVSFYNKDMEKLYSNYKSLENLDYQILKELNVDIKMLKDALKEKIKGKKNVYWNLLFKRYTKITERLTCDTRKKLLEKVYKNTNIDFTEKNIMTVTLWVIKNANSYFESQLKDYFLRLANPESIVRYKSNKRYNDDDWKYLKEEFAKSWNHNKESVKNYMLDYRIICEGYSNFDRDWLSDSAFELIRDTVVIAKNLGFKFDNIFSSDVRAEKAFKNKDILYSDGTVFCNIKLYQNGNRHFKFDKKFMKKMNVEVSRLNGWIRSKEEAKSELGLNDDDVSEMWGKNLKLEFSNTLLLT